MNLLFMNNGLPPYGIPRNGLVSIIDTWRDTYGRNILPAGSGNFVLWWTNYGDETISVTDYPTTIPGVGAVTAKRITGTGNGISILKYYLILNGMANPHTLCGTVWMNVLSGSAKLRINTTYSNVKTTNTWEAISIIGSSYASTSGYIYFATNNITDKLDILVYQPQVNLGQLYPYAPPAGLPQSLTDYSGHGNTFQLGSAAGSDTNDPKYNGVALVGDGVDDYAVASFASAAYRISIVDSGSGYTFVNEVPAYLNLFKTGASTYLNGKIGPTAYYNRVLTAGEIAQAKAGLKRYMASKGVTVS